MLGNKIVILLLSTILIMSDLLYGNNNKISNFKSKNLEECAIYENDFTFENGLVEDISNSTFEDELKYLKEKVLDISDFDIAKLKKLYDKALANKESNKAWDEYYNFYDELVGDIPDITFADELKYLKEQGLDISDFDMVKLKKLYNKALANKVWDEYYNFYDELVGMIPDSTLEDGLKYLKEIGIDISDFDMAKLKKLYDKALVNKESNKAWDEYYSFYYELTGESYYDTFENELKNLKEMNITPTLKQRKKLEKSFNVFLELEKKSEYELATEAYDKYKDLVDDMFGDLMDEYKNAIDIHGIYNIINNRLVLSVDKNDYPENSSQTEVTSEMKKLHQKLWDRVSEIIPYSYKKYIKKFEIGTDGIDGKLASVIEINDLSNWSLFIDITDVLNNDDEFSNDFEATIIHEFAHILTLNNTQLTEKRTNNTYNAEEGSSRVNSYLNKFYNKFWKNVDLNEDQYNRYNENSSMYVTEYAANNVEEDIAESFSFFVLEDKKKGKTIAEEKVNFFYNFNELIQLRNKIRENLNLK